MIRIRKENVVLEQVTASPVPPRPACLVVEVFNLDTLFEKAISFSHTKVEFTTSKKIVGYTQIYIIENRAILFHFTQCYLANIMLNSKTFTLSMGLTPSHKSVRYT